MTRKPLNIGSFEELVAMPQRAVDAVADIEQRLKNPGPPPLFTSTTMQSDLALAKFHLDKSKKDLFASSVVVDAVNYYAEKISGK
ncbi:hypothetical protein COB72_06025 [bacterium]|nr:MAG: hypothetical protein COB72_06025 [bacterium]